MAVSYISPDLAQRRDSKSPEKYFTDASHSSEQMGKLSLRGNLNCSPLLDTDLKYYLGPWKSHLDPLGSSFIIYSNQEVELEDC